MPCLGGGTHGFCVPQCWSLCRARLGGWCSSKPLRHGTGRCGGACPCVSGLPLSGAIPTWGVDPICILSPPCPPTAGGDGVTQTESGAGTVMESPGGASPAAPPHPRGAMHPVPCVPPYSLLFMSPLPLLVCISRSPSAPPASGGRRVRETLGLPPPQIKAVARRD